MLRGNDLENISLTELRNLRCVSYDIGCRWQVSCLGFWEYAVLYPNVIILRTENFSAFFVPFMEPPSNFKYFGKKDDRYS